MLPYGLEDFLGVEDDTVATGCAELLVLSWAGAWWVCLCLGWVSLGLLNWKGVVGAFLEWEAEEEELVAKLVMMGMQFIIWKL